MKRETFREGLTLLVNSLIINREFTETTRDIYWEMLKDIPDVLFSQAVGEIIRSCSEFPTIAEIRKTVADLVIPTGNPMEEWRCVLAILREYGYLDLALFQNSFTVKAIKRVGKERIEDMLVQDEPHIRKEFITVYKDEERKARWALIKGDIAKYSISRKELEVNK